MNWIYINNSNHIICYELCSWLPGETLETSFPVPESLGLTCIQEGANPNVILLHEDIFILPGDSYVCDIPCPHRSLNCEINIFNLSPNSPVLCCFNQSDNSPIILDVRGFSHVLDWSLCSRVFLNNNSDSQAHISLSVSEVA